MDKAKITIRNMDFYYGQKQVIFDLNLDFASNKITSIIGPANSGVTTLLRCLNRLSDLTVGTKMKGEILIDEQNIRDNDVDINELRRRVGMVFDVPTPLPMSIYNNLVYGPRLAGQRNKKVLDEIVEKALQEAALWTDVKDRLDSPATSLSGGQQQRLCIARVLALQPQVILLDRPCSGLDPISTAKIEESLMKLKEKITIILAPHNTQQASRVSDRLVFLLMGRLIEEGESSEVFSYPQDQRTSDYITGRFG